MSVSSMPHFTLQPDELVKWLEDQPDAWWVVDGDPLLTSEVDLPCPSDELVVAVRRIGKPLVVFAKNKGTHDGTQEITAAQLDELADFDNPTRKKTFLLSWADSQNDWLLSEDSPLTP